MKFTLLFCGLWAAAMPAAIFAQSPHHGKSIALSNAAILIIRHAEKPAKGHGLNAAGNARAQAYVNYFRNFKIDGQPMQPDYLFAAADSKESHRPFLTIEPASKVLGLAIDSRFDSSQSRKLADEIRARSHGKLILICWHHGDIPQLIKALGADSGQMIPNSKWPDSVFNWVIQLRYDSDGRLVEAKRIKEQF